MRDYGGFIRGARKAKDMRQIDLAGGLCSKDTVSRIENGSQTPTAVTFSLLVERLGVSGFSYGDFCDGMSARLMELRYPIRAGFESGNTDDLPELLGEYRDNLREGDIWDEQFYGYAKARYLHMLNGRDEEYLSECKRCLEMTMPRYRERKHFELRSLTRTECSIICEIAIYENKAKNSMEAITLFNKLIVQLRNFKSIDENYIKTIAILFNNAAICEAEHYPREAELHFNKSIRAVVRWGIGMLLLRVIRNKHLIMPNEECKEMEERMIRTVLAFHNRLCPESPGYESFMAEEKCIHLI